MRRVVLLTFTLSGWLTAQQPESAESPPAAQQPPERQPAPRPEVAAESVFAADMVHDLAWRNVGPANPMGRITDIEVVRQKKSTWYIGSAGGGVWKTTNAGTTWKNVFEHAGNVSIGDVATAPSNPEHVWVGTGEENARNSVQWGDGVYKSTDGGDNWQCMGLRDTFQIGHIAIHPQNPDIVFVGALGRLWGENAERGVFRSKDGGKTWDKVLYLDDKTGCIDVRIDGRHPETVYACMYERKRNIFDDNDPAVKFGSKAGIFKSEDGGDNWHQLTNGLPTCKWGRSGIDVWDKNPDVLLAIIETERCGWARGDRKDRNASDPPEPPTPGQGGPGGPGGGQGTRGDLGVGREGADGKDDAPGAVLEQVTADGAADKAGLKVGDRITRVGDTEVKSYEDLLSVMRTARADDKVKVTLVRGSDTKEIELTYGRRDFGGGNDPAGGARLPNGGQLGGQLPNRQKRQDELGFETGGVFRSDDRGETWKRINSLTERPFYYSIIRVDAQDQQNIYCVGTTLWGSFDGGEKFEAINRGIHVDFHAFWVDPKDGNHLLAGCDGGVNESFDRGATWQVHSGFCAAQLYDVVADNSVPYNVVGGLQDNGTWIGPSRSRNREGITNDDWHTIWSGDGFGAQTDPLEPWIVYATSQGGALGFLDMRTGNQARIDRARPEHGTARFNWDAPFILSPHNRLVLYQAGNFVFRGDRYAYLDNRQNRASYGPIKNQDAMRMLPISPQLGLTNLGTAVSIAESPRVRGLLYVGTDDGALWRTDDDGHDWKQLQQNLPIQAPRYVSDIVPSHFRDNRVYLTLDGHRFDDFRTYVFVSTDRGDTWKSLADDLGLHEPCYSFMEDPRNENLLYLGTEYGCYVSLDRGERWFPLGRDLPTVAVRDLFVQDRDSDLVAATHGRGVWIVDIEPLRQLTAAVAKAEAHLFTPENAILWQMQSRGLQGQRDYRAPNPPYGATVYLLLRQTPKAAPVVTIHDVTGKQLTELQGKAHAGLQALQWDARIGQRLATPGSYAARLTVGEHKFVETLQLLPDPKLAGSSEPSEANPSRDRE